MGSLVYFSSASGNTHRLIARLGLTHVAAYCERVSLGEEKIVPLESLGAETAPYFSMILIYRGGEEWIRTLAAGGASDAA